MENDERQDERAEKRAMLLVAAIAVSLGCHIALVYGFGGRSFSSISADARSDRRWTRDLPSMHVARTAGDPMAAALNARGRPEAAPVIEKDDARVKRLADDAAPTTARAVPAARLDAAVYRDEIKTLAPPTDDEALRPRQEILEITNPVHPEDAAALPRKVVTAVPRIASGAHDVVPPSAGPAALPAPAALPQLTRLSNGASAVSALPLPLPVPEAPKALLPGGVPGGDFDPFGLGAAVNAAPRMTADGTSAAKNADAPDGTSGGGTATGGTAVKAAVDVKAVERTKEQVRTLRDERPGESFEENVKASLAYWIDPRRPRFRYFRVRISSDAQNPLPIVAKDVLFLLDASGSIAQDRLKACRKAVSAAILCLNTDDRFNVVAFRDKFSYAFKEWQPVESYTKMEADKWLDRQVARGNTDVFGVMRSMLAVPRDPKRPMIALVVTDGEATSGLTRSAEIISKFSALNGGLVSVYMYGVKGKANAYLMDMLARENRGDWGRNERRELFKTARAHAADGIPALAAKFQDPVLADVAVTFATDAKAEVYPRCVSNLYRAQPIEIWGVCPADRHELIFSVRGLAAGKAYESLFHLPFGAAEKLDESAPREWAQRRLYALVGAYTERPDPALMRDIRAFAADYGVQIPYEESLKK